MKNFPSEKWLFWVYYPVVSISINLIGQGNSFSKLIRIPSFYSDLLLGFVLSFSVGCYLSFIWHNEYPNTKFPARLIRRRLLYGLFFPFVLCVFIEAIYLVWLLEIPLGRSPIFVLDSPLIFIFLLFANLFYLVRFLLTRQQKIIDAKSAEIKSINTSKNGEFITISQTNKRIKISLDEILYVMFENGIVFLFLENSRKVPAASTLKLIADKLPPQDFFPANRQLILTRKSVKSYQATTSRKLKLKITDRPEDDFYIPKSKVRDFKIWIGE